MPRVCIVESREHPAPRRLDQRLRDFGDFTARTVETFPDNLDGGEALVLNSISAEPGCIPQERILQFVEGGGGLLGLHDSVFPYGGDPRLATACGIRRAYDAVQIVQTQDGRQHQVLLARADAQDPMQRFPIRASAQGLGHPILREVGDFELAEEVWAQNLAAGVSPLLSVQVGDIVPAHQRFRDPIPIAGCKALGHGRIAFFSLGHFPGTYDDVNFLRFAANAILWVTRNINEDRFAHDIFLSFSDGDREQAGLIRDRGHQLGLNVFMSARDLQGGDVWDEAVRDALVGSREVAILMTPTSLRSEWVATEWGAAWAMQKRITPVLLRCNHDQLPDRLRRFQALDFHNFEQYLNEVVERAGA